MPDKPTNIKQEIKDTIHKVKKTSVRSIVTGRIVSILPVVLLQGLIIYALARWLVPFATLFYSILSVLSALFVLYLISKRDEGAYKMLWLLVMFVAPLPGALMYLLYGNKRTGKALEQRIKAVNGRLPVTLANDDDVQRQLEQEDKRIAQTFAYMKRLTGFPVLRNASAQYYPVGELLFEQMLSALKEAKRYVFIEYFIVQEGVLWQSMVEVMEQKVQEGVDIRVLYDDIGSIGTFSHKNRKSLLKKGIKCEKFNPMIVLSGALNNRDHRKIMVVDGMVAFSGGINLADEYINEEHPFGHWKDIGFKITGDAVRSYAYMFIEFWNASSFDRITNELIGKDYDQIQIQRAEHFDGYVQPYYDSPNREEAASNNLFIDLLGQSKEYAWFYTPYLLLGDGLRDAFVRAAKRGVDVRIIMPGIPDKKVVYRMSRSYYYDLLEAGVRIFEYTPGFVHAKASLVDDCIGSVGTVNLDYRSLYLHYECNALFYRASLLKDLKKIWRNQWASAESALCRRSIKDWYTTLWTGSCVSLHRWCSVFSLLILERKDIFMYIGNHLSSADGYEIMGKEALKLGGNTFAFFTRNPRGGAVKAHDPEDAAKLCRLMEEHHFGRLVAHAPYTLNVCSDKEKIRKFSREAMAEDIRRMEYLPGNYYNFHPGSHVGQGTDVAIPIIAEAINYAVKPEYTTTVLLETMAGKGSEVGRSFEELRAIIDLVEYPERVGVCFDTCHVWDGGYDIVGDLDGVLKTFDHIIGLERLKAVHFNDSMNGCGSHKDRHQKIGEGEIGTEALKAVAKHPLLKDKPFILETPNDDEGYIKEIAMVRSW